MTKSYADQCLERAEKAQAMAVQKHFDLETGCEAYLELKRLDNEMRDKIVPELARRLKKALINLKAAAEAINSYVNIMSDPYSIKLLELADELEAPLEEK